MAEEEMELALRQPLRRPPFQLFPSLYENVGSSCIVFGPPPADIDRTVMMLLMDDKDDIEAGKIFTQCDRIKESNCIFLTQYIEVLRKMKHYRLLDSYENNMDKKLVDIKPYVLLLRRLSLKLVQFYPKRDNTRDPICTYVDPSYCLTKNHLHLCPYDFLRDLGQDLLNITAVLNLGNPSDDMGLKVTLDLDMCTDNLQRVVDLLQR